MSQQQPQYVLCPPGFQPPAGQQVVYVVPQQQQQQQPTTPPQGQVVQQQQQTSPTQPQFTASAQMFPAPGQQPITMVPAAGSPPGQQQQQQFMFQTANGQQQPFIMQPPTTNPVVGAPSSGPPPYQAPLGAATGIPMQGGQNSQSFTFPSPSPSPSSVALGTPQTHRLNRPPAYRPAAQNGGSRPRLGSGFSSSQSAAQSANTIYLQNTNNSVSPPPLSISASQSAVDPLVLSGAAGGGKQSRHNSHQFTKLADGEFGSGTLDQTFGTLDSLAGGELGEALAEAKVQAEADGTALAMIEELRREPTDRAVRAKVLKIPHQLCMAMVVVLDKKSDLLLGLCNKDRGNVVCHLIEKLGGDQCFCLIRFALDNFQTLAMNQSGCIALPRILQFVKPTQREVFFETMLSHFDELITHQYGNYVVKHFLCAGESKNISGIVDQIVRAPAAQKQQQQRQSSSVAGDDAGGDGDAASPASPAILKETSQGMEEKFSQLVEADEEQEDGAKDVKSGGESGSSKKKEENPLGGTGGDALNGSTSTDGMAKATGVDVLLNDSTLSEAAVKKDTLAEASKTAIPSGGEKENRGGGGDSPTTTTNDGNAAAANAIALKVIEGSSPMGVNVYEVAARDLAVDHDRLAALATNKFGSHIIDDAFKMCKDSSALKLVLAFFKDQATLKILAHDKFGNYNIQSAYKYINGILQDSNLQQFCLQNTIPVMPGCQYQQNIMKHAVTTGGGRGGGGNTNNNSNNRGGGDKKGGGGEKGSSPGRGGGGGHHRNSQGPNNSPGNRGGGGGGANNGNSPVGGGNKGGSQSSPAGNRGGAAVRPMAQLQPPSPPQQQQTFTLTQQQQQQHRVSSSSATNTPPNNGVGGVAYVDPFASASQSMSPVQQHPPQALPPQQQGTFTIFPANR